jgi:hypothetical protein
MRNLIFCISIVFLLSCSNPTHNKNSVEISSHIIDITLDECVDSFYVRRIISDTPLSQIHYLQIVNDRLFLWDNGGIIYYMKGDSIVSKLEAIGRGHGEYQYISAFAFSEPDSALFVHSGSNSKILKYSVPSFDFVSSINCELGIRAMRVYDGKIIAFCSTPGRKIIVDTYGGKGGHGGGAFSGKDPSKVDRSAAYATRHIAKNLVAAGVADEVLVQVSYAIGVAEPINIFVNTFGTAHVEMTDSQIAKKVNRLFDMRPYAIEKRLKLRSPIYSETAAYGHMGRTPETVTKVFRSNYMPARTIQVELFTWEKLDYVDRIKEAFGI